MSSHGRLILRAKHAVSGNQNQKFSLHFQALLVPILTTSCTLLMLFTIFFWHKYFFSKEIKIISLQVICKAKKWSSLYNTILT